MTTKSNIGKKKRVNETVNGLLPASYARPRTAFENAKPNEATIAITIPILSVV